MLPATTLFFLGVGCLVVGGHTLVRGASELASGLKLSPLVIGLTVVAFGTSLPELAVTFAADMEGAADIAVGNVVGSNIANLALVLGAASLVMPLSLEATNVSRDLVISILAAIVVGTFGLNGTLGRSEASLLVAALGAYILTLYRGAGGKDQRPLLESLRAAFLVASVPRALSFARSLAAICLGLGLLVLGAHLAVQGAVALAELAGLKTAIVGLTIVAVGTSLPELATSVTAALKREAAISVGNIFGSNIFNMLGVLGITGAARPLSMAPNIVRYDVPVLIMLSVLCIPMLASRRISRRAGSFLIFCYIAYCVWLFAIRGPSN